MAETLVLGDSQTEPKVLGTLRKIHFYIVAASIGLLTVAVLLPRSNEQVAQDQVLALQKVFDGQGGGILSLINERALASVGAGASEYFDETAEATALFSMMDFGQDAPEFDPAEIVKYFTASGLYKITIDTVDNDFIGPNKPSLDSWEARFTQANKVIDIVDFASFAGDRTVEVSFSSNLWFPMLGERRGNGCVQDSLSGPLASFGQRMEGPMRFMLDQNSLTLGEIKEWWNIAQSLRVFSFESMLPKEFNFEVSSAGNRVGSAKLTLVKGSLVKGPRNPSESETEPLFVRLCTKGSSAYFTNDISSVQEPFLAVLSPVETKEVSLIPQLVGDVSTPIPDEPFDKAFATLDEYSESFDDLTLPQLERVFATLASRTQAAIDIAGIKIATNNIKLVGAAAVLALLMFFSAHLSNAVSRLVASEGEGFTWIAIYEDRMSRLITSLSLLVLPIGTIFSVFLVLVSEYQFSRSEYVFTNPQTWKDTAEIFAISLILFAATWVGVLIIRNLRKCRSLVNV